MILKYVDKEKMSEMEYQKCADMFFCTTVTFSFSNTYRYKFLLSYLNWRVCLVFLTTVGSMLAEIAYVYTNYQYRNRNYTLY